VQYAEYLMKCKAKLYMITYSNICVMLTSSAKIPLLFLLFASCCICTTNNTNSAVNATIFLLIWVTLHVSTLKGPSSGVSSYTLLITGLQREIPIFLLTYTGHKLATLMFIYILFTGY
jgi:hypothetical protein